jgi:hypothetical protein
MAHASSRSGAHRHVGVDGLLQLIGPVTLLDSLRAVRPVPETDRFVAYFESMADVSGIVLARGSVTVR